jgi:hypothetical protein
MKRSGDLVIWGSGDRKVEFTAETRSRGEHQKPTTEARTHGEGSGDRVIARDRVIGKAACNCHPERVGAYATASRRIPTMPVPEYAASGSSYEAANLTAETWRRGENQKPTTEARRHGESDGSDGFPNHPITCDHPITRFPSAPALISKTIRTLLAAIREIFDESAYDRFLLRTHGSRSIASYREFTRERDGAVLKKPRCC